MHRNRAIRSKDEAKPLSAMVSLASLVTGLVGRSRRSTLRFWQIYLFLYDFYLGNRNCAEILGPIALVEMEAPPGKVLNRFHGFVNRPIPAQFQALLGNRQEKQDSESRKPPLSLLRPTTGWQSSTGDSCRKPGSTRIRSERSLQQKLEPSL